MKLIEGDETLIFSRVGPRPTLRPRLSRPDPGLSVGKITRGPHGDDTRLLGHTRHSNFSQRTSFSSSTNLSASLPLLSLPLPRLLVRVSTTPETSRQSGVTSTVRSLSSDGPVTGLRRVPCHLLSYPPPGHSTSHLPLYQSIPVVTTHPTVYIKPLILGV